jgi:hypothetical protein
MAPALTAMLLFAHVGPRQGVQIGGALAGA